MGVAQPEPERAVSSRRVAIADAITTAGLPLDEVTQLALVELSIDLQRANRQKRHDTQRTRRTRAAH